MENGINYKMKSIEELQAENILLRKRLIHTLVRSSKILKGMLTVVMCEETDRNKEVGMAFLCDTEIKQAQRDIEKLRKELAEMEAQYGNRPRVCRNSSEADRD
jgi:hypothetical protein